MTVIRRATRDDLEDLAELERAASTTALAHVFQSIPFPADDIRVRWALLLEEGSVTVLVDELDEIPVGYAAFGDGWLHHFAVVPKLWGTGRAADLHAVVLERSAAAGTPTTYLWVLVDNHRARAFYARQGWTDTGVREREVFEPYPEKMQMQRPPDEEAPSSSPS